MKLSQGQFIGAISLLELLSARGPSDLELVSELLLLRIGRTHAPHIKAATLLCERLKLIADRGRGLELTLKGEKLLSKASSSSLKLARELLFLAVTKDFPELISLAFQSPRTRSRNLDSDMKDCFDECLLLEFRLDSGAITWWTNLAEMGTFSDSGGQAALGRASEERSIEYEKNRLFDEGFAAPEELVTWISEENDFAGFDILSRNGRLYSDSGRNDSLRIEVKTGRIEDESFFSFMISSREVSVSQASRQPWALHVWFLRAIPGLRLNVPLILGAEHVKLACPVDSPSSKWEKTRLFFPFHDFAAT